jgi:anti-sigma B factor antagonist
MDQPDAHARLTVTDDSRGSLTATFSGELDIAGVTAVEATLDELLGRPPQPLLLQLNDVEFLDSSGVSMLIRLANHFHQVRTRTVADPVRRVIEVLGLADLLGLDGA